MSGRYVVERSATARACLAAAGALALAAAAAGGCSPEPAAPPSAQSAKAAPADGRLLAVEPFDMAEEASTQPVFKWKLPASAAAPTSVTFKLAEAGRADAPIRDENAQQEIAIATGLAEASPTALDLFHPPAGCNLTGEVTAMSQLKGRTWYRWTVRVTNPKNPAAPETTFAHADFYFRTRGQQPPEAPAPSAARK